MEEIECRISFLPLIKELTKLLKEEEIEEQEPYMNDKVGAYHDDKQ